MVGQPWTKHYQDGVSSSMEYPRISLAQMLEQSAAKYPDQIALVFQGVSQTYSSLLETVYRLAYGLNKLGVSKGDRVAIMLPNCPQWVTSYFAVLKLGAIVVQTNPMYVERELEFQLNDSGAESIIVLDTLLPRVQNIKEKTSLRNIICVSFAGKSPEGTLDFQSVIKQSPATVPAVEINARGDIALLQYTGGTTGTAKGVMLTHYNLMVNVVQLRAWMPFLEEGKEKVLTVLPLFHVYAMTAANNLSVLLGATQYLLPRFELEPLLKVINDFRPSLFPGAPTLYIAIINYPHLDRYDLSSIKACVSGSAPLPVEVAERFFQLTGGRLVEGYGLSESSPVTHINPMDGNARVGSIGLPIPDTEARIVDLESGNQVLKPGETGELIIKGPQVMKGYWNISDSLTLRDGWLYTGDIATMDEDGYFYIVDRKKDMIIAGGFNIYPRDIEEVLYEHPAVQETVVIGIADTYRGETVKAFVVLRPGQQSTAEDMIAYCRQKLAAYKVPQYIQFVDALPKTAVGKILRRALREMDQRDCCG